MEITIDIIIGIIVGIALALWLVPITKTNIILSIVLGVLGSFIGTSILSTYSSMIGLILTALIGSVCLTILVLFVTKTTKDLISN